MISLADYNVEKRLVLAVPHQMLLSTLGRMQNWPQQSE